MSGAVAAHRWWQPARAHAAVRVVDEFVGSVIAFGAGHSHYEDRQFFELVRDATIECRVVSLLPDPDPQKSIDVLRVARSSATSTSSVVTGNTSPQNSCGRMELRQV